MQRIATSPLVKTALFGHDANWGHVLMAAGGAVQRRVRAVDAARVSLSYNGTAVLVAARRGVEPPSTAGCTIDLDPARHGTGT